MFWQLPPPPLPQVRAGRLRALAMASLKRTTFAPDVPTLVESGLPGFEAGVWYGMMGPAGLPPEIVARLSQELARIVRLPDVRERLAVEGVEQRSSDPLFGVYRAGDGRFVRIHTNFAHHRDGMLAMLGAQNTRESVAVSPVGF